MSPGALKKLQELDIFHRILIFSTERRTCCKAAFNVLKANNIVACSPNDTAVNVEELNATYQQVIGICKIAPRLLPKVATAIEDFSFNRILSRLH
jgi:hypothetical protein